MDALKPYPSYRDSGQPWLGQVPEYWDVRRNGRLFAERNQTGFADLPILEVSLRTGVRIRDMENGARKQQMADRSKYKRAARGDIAYNMMRMWQGAVGVAPVDGLISPAYVVAHPFPKVEPRYYAYLFRTPAYMREVDKFSRGIVSDRNRLYWDEFKQMPSAFPPTEEQIRIADFLDAHGRRTTRLIRNKRRLIELAEERLNVSTKEMLASSSAEYRLELAADFVQRAVERTAFQVYTPVGLYNRGRGLFHKPQTAGDELGDSSFFWIEDGDLILSGQFAWEGAVALAGPQDAGCIASHRYPILRGKTGVATSAFLFAFFRTDYGQLLLDHHSRGAAGRNRPLNVRSLKKEKIPVPSLSSQERIEELVSLLASLRKKFYSESQAVREYRERLIADVVTGKLDVRHVELAAAPEVMDEQELEEPEAHDDEEDMAEAQD